MHWWNTRIQTATEVILRRGRNHYITKLGPTSLAFLLLFGGCYWSQPLNGQQLRSGAGGANLPSRVQVSISPAELSVWAGLSVQFKASIAGSSNQAVRWTAALGTISPSGLYTAPNVNSDTVDTVSATSVADPNQYTTASVAVQARNTSGTGGDASTSVITATTASTAYSISTPPGPAWFPFANAGSITNKPLPSDVLKHCWGNTSNCSAGDAIAKWTLTSGYGATNFSRNGLTVGFVYFPNTLTNGSSADVSGPMYYGSSSDPWYKIAGCKYNSINVRFHAPNKAKFSALPGGDQGIDVYDAAQGLIIQAYGYLGGSGMIMPDASGCPGSGPSSCAVSVPNISGCSAQQVGVDSDLQGHTYRTASIGGNTYTLGGTGATTIFSGWAGMLRQNELMNGTVNHALLLGVVCAKPGSSSYQSDWVWPAQAGVLKCNTSSASEPKAGSLLFCDYTPTQITSMLNAGQISLPQATLLRAFCTYGGYVTQTSGPASGSTWQGMRLAAGQGYEGQTAYQLYYKQNNSFESWACSHRMNDFGQGGCSGGTLTAPYGPNQDVLGGIPRLTGPGGHDISGRSCSTAPGCDVSGHIHVADPCVAVGLSGKGSVNGITACY